MKIKLSTLEKGSNRNFNSNKTLPQKKLMKQNLNRLFLKSIARKKIQIFILRVLKSFGLSKSSLMTWKKKKARNKFHKMKTFLLRMKVSLRLQLFPTVKRLVN